MFLIQWSPEAFDQMQRLIADHPDRRTDFTYALRTLAYEPNQIADVWGESRSGNQRLGYAGPLSVAISVDPDDRVARALSVVLSARRPRP